ncbi:hypothetical protein BGZ82_000411 [Podila clonocystis]|nr:hypothetical protein BGZ82_000411 [Podila clonocystis]
MNKEEVIVDDKFDSEKVDHEDNEKQLELQDEDNSSIEEVRVTVPNTDDPSIPCNTFHMWLLGLLFTAIISVLPTTQYNLFGRSFSLNPGPFSIKEHVLIGIMASCNTTTAYAVDIVILQKLFYNEEKPFIAGLLLVLTTQITGFALAGSLRKFLVRPAHMIWPSTLVYASLFRSLHHVAEEPQDSNRMSRMKLFLLVTLSSFVWYWLPEYIFPTIGFLSWICCNPNSSVLSQITSTSGLGVGAISLDWSSFAVVTPLVTPWFAQVNIIIGFALVVYVMLPWAYYTDLWHSKNYPILSAHLFQENGTLYDNDKILTKNILDQQKYLDYGPMRMDSFFALTYGVGFAGLTATIVHVLLYNGKEIVPQWWYGILFVITLALSFVTCIVWNYMPWWAVILAMAIAIFFVLPVGIVQAVTNQQLGLNIITEYVIGYILPGHAIANVTFKTYGYIVNVQALTFIADLKLGQYMKISPRIMYMTQLLSTIIACTVNLATATWLVNTRPNICTEEGYPFTCRNTNTFYSASVIWGAIGPARAFGNKDGALYSPVQWGFLVGAVLPLIFWLLARKFPNVKLVHWRVLLAAMSYMPPYLPYMYSNGLFVGFIFMFLIRRYNYGWWTRYNYLTSAALDSGVAIASLVIYFTLQNQEINFPEGQPLYGTGSPPTWQQAIY